MLKNKFKSKKQKTQEKFSSHLEKDNPAYVELFNLYGLDTHKFDLEIANGSILEGTLIGQTNKHILVDVGHKDFVMIDAKKDEFIVLDKMGKKSGDTIEVMITDFSQDPFHIMGSFISLDKKSVYDGLLNHSSTGILMGKIIESSPAGFKVELNQEGFKIQAFMPNTLAGINRLSQEQSNALVGTEIEVMVETYQEDKGTFVVSRKKYLQTLIPLALEAIKITDEQGNPIRYSGVVTGTTKFGVFVEFNGCLTGMIHSVNLSEGSNKMLQAGEINSGAEIDFFVKENIKGKLILTQVWRTTLWDTVSEDDTYEVTIKEFKKFGALVNLDHETVGLVHNREIERSKKSLKVGDKLKVKVFSVQRTERKIFLSII